MYRVARSAQSTALATRGRYIHFLSGLFHLCDLIMNVWIVKQMPASSRSSTSNFFKFLKYITCPSVYYVSVLITGNIMLYAITFLAPCTSLYVTHYGADLIWSYLPARYFLWTICNNFLDYSLFESKKLSFRWIWWFTRERCRIIENRAVNNTYFITQHTLREFVLSIHLHEHAW
jgi:hypothetical protein